MKRLAVFGLLLFLLISCKSGPLNEIRAGNSFAVLVPEDIAVYGRASLQSEHFFLEEAEEFKVIEAVCAEGLKKSTCLGDLALANRFPHVIEQVFYLVRFESGKQGYISARYFYPELSYGMISEQRAMTRGTTPREYAAKVRKDRQALKDASARAVGDKKNELKELETARQRSIEAAAWPSDIKELVLEGKVRAGMTKEQVMLSIKNPRKLPVVTKKDSIKGASEQWEFDNAVYRFENDILESWIQKKKGLR